MNESRPLDGTNRPDFKIVDVFCDLQSRSMEIDKLFRPIRFGNGLTTSRIINS